MSLMTKLLQRLKSYNRVSDALYILFQKIYYSYSYNTKWTCLGLKIFVDKIIWTQCVMKDNGKHFLFITHKKYALFGGLSQKLTLNGSITCGITECHITEQ